MTIQRRALAVVLLAILAGTPALAQSTAQTVDGWSAARWRFGPLAVTPRVELKNLGWDSNVFNTTDEPKSDFTTLAAGFATSGHRFLTDDGLVVEERGGGYEVQPSH